MHRQTKEFYLGNIYFLLKENNDLLERLAINGKSASQIFSREAQAESTLEVLKISTNHLHTHCH